MLGRLTEAPVGTAIYVAPGLHLFKTGFWPAFGLDQ